jgi:hypothetical protein
VNPFDLLPKEIDDFFHSKAMESKSKKKSEYGDRVLSKWYLNYIALPDLAKVTWEFKQRSLVESSPFSTRKSFHCQNDRIVSNFNSTLPNSVFPFSNGPISRELSAMHFPKTN